MAWAGGSAAGQASLQKKALTAIVKRDLPWTETNSDSQMRAARNVQAVQSNVIANMLVLRSI